MDKPSRSINGRTISKARAAGLLAAASLLATSLGMMRAQAEDQGVQHGSGGGAGKVKLDSKQDKYRSNQYKEDVASPKLGNSQTHPLNPQPLPPGRK